MVIVFFSMGISYLFCLLGVLISVAFMILLERKVLGYLQTRKGPNKVGYMGIIQSFSDAMKLFLKEFIFPYKINFMIFYSAPTFLLVLVLLMWILIPLGYNSLNSMLGGLFFFCCTAFGVYMLLGGGWSSNSNYSMMGTIRNIAQTISYEVSMALIFLCVIFYISSFNGVLMFSFQYNLWVIWSYFPLFFCWVVSMLAETNRTPFDFAEGESELVSGFNVEYSSGGFTLLFLSEYSSIIFMSFFIIIIFMGGLLIKGSIYLGLGGCFFTFFFIWIRGCLPRYRYDKLMMLMWKIYLPLSLFFMGFYISMKLISGVM